MPFSSQTKADGKTDGAADDQPPKGRARHQKGQKCRALKPNGLHQIAQDILTRLDG
ncbi:hypothetical protein JCM17846_13140 [Iodidimonas nitroreducens]|uniref:Uncharacterized protein n=1 Tax=Iodidimonas nitroreducens TaxID=1236968 RepID=A0A5A7N5N4_9PROT|nr:hypothetical protein JCM17846_13140 [Iodidimonas nitroreducens]